MQRGSSFCFVSSMKASCTQSSGESVHCAAKSTSAPPCSSSRRLKASGVSNEFTRFLPLQHHYDDKWTRFSQGSVKKVTAGKGLGRHRRNLRCPIMTRREIGEFDALVEMVTWALPSGRSIMPILLGIPRYSPMPAMQNAVLHGLLHSRPRSPRRNLPGFWKRNMRHLQRVSPMSFAEVQ